MKRRYVVCGLLTIATAVRASPSQCYTGTPPISISGSAISCLPASGVAGGCLTTTEQTIAGAKTFNSDGGVWVDHATGNVPYGSKIGPWNDPATYGDGGVRPLGIYNCGGPTSAVSHGVHCLTNQTGPLEISGYVPPDSVSPDQCNIEAASSEQRSVGYLLCTQNGPTKVWKVSVAGATEQAWLQHFTNAGAAYIIADQPNTEIELYGNFTPGLGGGLVGIANVAGNLAPGDYYIGGYATGIKQWDIDWGGSLRSSANAQVSTVDHRATVTNVTGTAPLAFIKGQAQANLQVCDLDAGSLLQWVNDRNTYCWCNGTDWRCPVTTNIDGGA